MESNLLQLFPMDRRYFWKHVAERVHKLQEIRMRVDKPVSLLLSGREYFLDLEGKLVDKPELAYYMREEELEDFLQHICRYSLYAFADELKQGFVTVCGGHRIGIAGQVVVETDGSVRTIKNISSVNIRIAHEIKGVGDKLLPALYQEGRVKNTLLISPPGCGKTTLLRDLIRQISNGNQYGRGRCVGLVDERSEIAGCYQGVPQNDVGIRTDVMDACPKAVGMMLLLRSMAPGVIAVDELGGERDMDALRMAASCGSSIIATVHGERLEEVITKFSLEAGAWEQLFEVFVFLGKKQGVPIIKKVCGREEIHASLVRGNYDCGRMFRTGNVVSAAVHSETSGA